MSEEENMFARAERARNASAVPVEREQEGRVELGEAVRGLLAWVSVADHALRRIAENPHNAEMIKSWVEHWETGPELPTTDLAWYRERLTAADSGEGGTEALRRVKAVLEEVDNPFPVPVSSKEVSGTDFIGFAEGIDRALSVVCQEIVAVSLPASGTPDETTAKRLSAYAGLEIALERAESHGNLDLDLEEALDTFRATVKDLSPPRIEATQGGTEQ